MLDFAGKRPSEIPIVVLDTETTGLYPAMGHRVVELGAVRFENGQEVAQMNTLLNPGRKMDPGASRVNGITDSDLSGTPKFEDVQQGMHFQSEGAQQIKQAMVQLSEAAQQAVMSIRQSNSAIDSLNDAAHALQNGVTRFRTKSQ